jgi:hypothetical protein
MRDNYSNDELKPFVETLLDKYYNSLETLCESAGKQAAKVNSLETEQTASEYVALCNDIIHETEQYVTTRKEKSIPYIHQLLERLASSHDCRDCSGSCKLNHDLQIIEFNGSHGDIKKVMNRLQLATLPLYSQTMYPDEYRILRNRMALLEMSMTELFFLENNYLLPKIVEAQKKINASSK